MRTRRSTAADFLSGVLSLHARQKVACKLPRDIVAVFDRQVIHASVVEKSHFAFGLQTPPGTSWISLRALNDAEHCNSERIDTHCQKQAIISVATPTCRFLKGIRQYLQTEIATTTRMVGPARAFVVCHFFLDNLQNLHGITENHKIRLIKTLHFILQNDTTTLRNAIQETATRRRWSPSTTLTFIGQLKGVILRVPQLRSVVENHIIKDMTRELQKKDHATGLTRPVLPAKTDQIKEMILHLRGLNQKDAALFLTICWATAQRPRDVLKLQARHVSTNGNEMTATLVEGKGVSARNRPYTVRAFIPWVGHLNAILRSGQNKVFASDKPMTQAREAMRNVAKHLEWRSVRRGALTTMALAGASQDTLMAMSGHTRPQTLMRYLDWGKSFTHQLKRTLAASRDLWSGLTE